AEVLAAAAPGVRQPRRSQAARNDPDLRQPGREAGREGRRRADDLGAHDARVVAIAHSLGLLSTWNCFVPIESLRALYQLNQDSTGVVQIMLERKDLEKIPQIAERLRS